MTDHRPLTAEERDRLAPVIDETTIPVRVASGPIEALVRPGVTEPPTGLRARLADWCFPWPTAEQRLASLQAL